MIDFTQWYEAMKASQARGFPGWNGTTITIVIVMVLIFAFLTFDYFIDGNTRRAWIATGITAIVMTIACTVFLFSVPSDEEPPENLAASVENAFDIIVTDWGERRNKFQQHWKWPDDGIYDITYVPLGEQKSTKGTVVVHGHSIGITDADGVYLKEVNND